MPDPCGSLSARADACSPSPLVCRDARQLATKDAACALLPPPHSRRQQKPQQQSQRGRDLARGSSGGEGNEASEGGGCRAEGEARSERVWGAQRRLLRSFRGRVRRRRRWVKLERAAARTQAGLKGGDVAELSGPLPGSRAMRVGRAECRSSAWLHGWRCAWARRAESPRPLTSGVHMATRQSGGGSDQCAGRTASRSARAAASQRTRSRKDAKPPPCGST